jgi:hypothetical protein
MGCEYIRPEVITIRQIGGPPIQDVRYFCKLKEADERTKISMCDHLLKIGIGGSFADDLCPFAENGIWEKCPFRPNAANNETGTIQ